MYVYIYCNWKLKQREPSFRKGYEFPGSSHQSGEFLSIDQPSTPDRLLVHHDQLAKEIVDPSPPCRALG